MAKKYASRQKTTSQAKAQLAQSGKAGALGSASIDIRLAMIAAANEANARTSKQLVALGRWFEANAKGSEKTKDLHQRILQMGQRSVAASYNATRKGPSGYREGDRLSGGKLRRAINATNFYQATSTSMEFINTTHLNNEARQWARLNFGAGAAGAASPRARLYPIRISNLVIGSLGLDEGPRPAFMIPKGFFTNEGEFHLGSARGEDKDVMIIPHRQVTRGIRATQFLDRGIERVASEIWPVYQRFLADLIRDGEVTNVRAVNSVTSSGKGRRR